MKIGLDLDDVTVDFLDHLLKFYHIKTGKQLDREKFTSFNLWENWGGTKQEAIKIVEEFHDSEYFEKITPLKDAVASINKLLDLNEIIVITSRPSLWEEKTKMWLNTHLRDANLRVIFSGDFNGNGKTKAEICEELGIKIMLDDNKDYARACAEKEIKVILFDTPWNQNFSHENVKRVFSWEEAVREIEKITFVENKQPY